MAKIERGVDIFLYTMTVPLAIALVADYPIKFLSYGMATDLWGSPGKNLVYGKRVKNWKNKF